MKIRNLLPAVIWLLLPALAFAAPTRALVNFSSLGSAGAAGSSAYSSSFTIEGSAAKTVLIRALGPKLAASSVVGFISDPALAVFNGFGQRVAENDNWGSAATSAALVSAASLVGASPLDDNSKDAAILATLAPGTYTARVDGVSGATGTAMVEVYDADTVSLTPRLAYFNLKTPIAAGGTRTIGFVIAAGLSQQVLIRGLGPALSSVGVTGALSNPSVAVFSGATQVATNDNWGSAAVPADLANAAVTAGLRPLADGSSDAALLTTLAPGAYTVQLTGVSGSSGNALFEIAVIDADRTDFAPALLGPVLPTAASPTGNLSYSALALGRPAPAYQWSKNGTAISGATNAGYFLPSVAGADAAGYSVTASNAAGSVNSLNTAATVWLQSSPTTVTGSFNGIAYSGTVYAAAGDSGLIYTSTDANTWSRITPASGTVFRSLAYGGGKFVAVGTGGTVRVSSDNGATWAFGSSGVTTQLNSVLYDGTRFVAVGASSTVITSTDGMTWAVGASLTPALALNAVAYKSGGNYVAVAATGEIYFSSTVANGFTWTAATSNTTAQLNAVAYLNDRFVAVGNSGTIRTSPTGTGSWNTISSPTTAQLNGVAYNAGTYVSTGGNTLITSSSADASTWTTGTFLPVGSAGSNALVHVNGQFVSVGFPGTVVTSTTGATNSWTLRTAPTTANFNDTVYANGRYVAVGGNAAILTTADGATLTALAPALPALSGTTLRRVAYGAGTYVAVGDGGTIITSPDGVAWANRSFGTANYTALVYAAGRFIVAGASGAYATSVDGQVWTAGTGTIGTANVTGLAYGGATPLYVAVNASGGIFTSSDATAWTAQTSGTTNQLNNVRFGGGQFFALGNFSTLLTSPDGSAWTHRGLGSANIALADVSHGGGLNIAVHTTSSAANPGFNGTIFLSPDGVTWTPVNLGSSVGSPLNLFAQAGITYGNGSFFIASNNGIVARTWPHTALQRIVTQPASATIAAGSSTTLSVATANSLPTTAYQWYRGSTGDTSTPISGATDASYTANTSARYWVRVSGASSPPIDSATANVLGAAPAIVTQPAANVATTVGGTATFTVAATPAGSVSYQWRRNGYPLPGATNASFTLTGVGQHHTDTYDVVVSDGLASVTSTPSRLAVAPTAYPGTIKLDTAFNPYLENDSFTNINAVVPYTFNGTTTVNQFLVAGDFVRVNGNAAIRRLARYNSDGTLDTSFAPAINWTLNAVLPLPDGKIVVGGFFGWVNGTARSNLARLNPDGSFDASFNTGAGPNASVRAIVRQPADGKLLIAGDFGSYNNTTVNRVCRLNTDGTLDSTFVTGSTQGVNNTVNALALDPVTGKVVIGGFFTSHSDGTSLNRIARLGTDGTRDSTFVVGTGFDNTVNALAFDATSNVLVGGAFTAYAGTTNVNRLVRLTSTGAIDTTFVIGTGTTAGTNNTVNSLAYDSANTRWLVGGNFTSYNNSATFSRLIRVSALGALDTAFNPNVNGTVLSLALQADGSALLGGSFNSIGSASPNTRALARVTDTGARDTSITGVFRGFGLVNRVLPLPGGKLLVTGSFTHWGETPALHVVRLKPDLTLDLAYAPAGGTGYTSLPTVTLTGGGATTPATATAILNPTNGQIFGFTVTAAGAGYTSAPSVALSGGGGSGATAFATVSGGVVTGVFLSSSNAGPNGSISAAAIQGDGRILLGGNFNNYNGLTANRVVRLLPDFTVDTSFNVAVGPNNTVQAIVPLATGGLYIAGNFGLVNNIARAGVARLGADGALDQTFNAGSTSYSAWVLAVQPSDGKVIVGGDFPTTTVNGVVRNNLVRFNSDGTVDTSFAAAGTNNRVRALALQPDGKILLGGDFTAYNGTTVNGYARLNPADGTLDSTYATNLPVGSLYSFLRQEDGSAKAIVFGGFTTAVGGAPISRLVARLNDNGTLDPSLNLQPNGYFIGTQPQALHMHDDGSLLVGTIGITVSGVERQGLVRFVPAAPPATIASLSASSVRPGDTLTLTGTNFADVTAIRFGGLNGVAATTFTVNSPTSLTVAVPTNAVSGPVVVQTFAGNAISSAPLAVAPDFQLRNPQITAASIENIAYGNGVYVIASTGGTIFSSENAVDWTRRYTGPDAFNGVTFAAGTFVAVAGSGTLLTSSDGLNWTSRAVATSSALMAAAHDGTKWLVVTTGTSVLTSLDAATWTLGSTTGGGSANGLAFGAGIFVAVANSGVVRTSPDGLTWTARTSNAGTDTLNDVVFVNNVFIAGGNAGRLITSPDGVTWTSRTTPNTSSQLFRAAYAVGGAVGSTGKYVMGVAGAPYVSTDLVTWTAVNSSANNGRSVIYGGGQFVSAGNQGNLGTSPDGVTWTLRASQGTRQWRDFAYGNGRFVGISNSTDISTSTDGATFTYADRIAGLASSLNGIAYANGLFVAVGGSAILTTADATTWTNRTPAGSFTLNSVAFGGSTWLAVGAGGVAYRSNDGLVWTLAANTGTTNSLNYVTYGGNPATFVVVGASGTIITSPDGVTWTNRTANAGTNSLNGVTFANNQFVATGAGSTLVTSPDGTTWSARTLPGIGVTMNRVAYGDGTYVAVANTSNFFFTSPDAITWTSRTPSLDSFNTSSSGGLAFGNGRFVAGAFTYVGSTNPASDTAFISTQPLAATAVAPNATANLSLTATGAGLTYQWYSGLSGDTSAPISGATSATFTTPAITTPRTFWARVTSGTTVIDSATSRVATSAAAPVVSSPPSDLDRTAGQSASFTFTATGNGALSTQWLRNGVAIPSATSATFAIPAVTRADAAYYSVAVSDTFGNTTVSAAARLTVAPTAYAQASVIDGAYARLYERTGGSLNRVLLQSDGKLVVAGDFSRIDGTLRTRLARFNADGTHDTTFTPPFLSVNINALAQDANGKLLVGGDFYEVAGDSRRNRLVRLNTNGTLDSTFNPGGSGPTSTVNVIRVLASGQLLVGGFFGTYNGSSVNGLARLKSDGTLDPSFSANLGSNVSAMVVQSDGRILVGGNFTAVNGFSRNRVARLFADGTLDHSFDPGTGPAAAVNALALQSNGSIILGGAFTTYNGATANRLARVTSTGALDTSFFALAGSGYTSAPTVTLTGGGFTTAATATAVLNSATGQIASFTITGGAGYTSAPTVSFSGGGGSGAAATAVVTGGAVTAINFNVSTGAQSTVNEIVVQPDNKIIFGGLFTSYNGTTAAATRLARLHPTGVLDTTFATGTGVNGTVTGLAVKLDGSNNVDGVFVGGSFTTVNTSTSRPLGLARLTTLGAIDTTLNPVSHRYGGVLSVTPLPAGKLLVAGDFSQIDGVVRGGLAKLEANGSLDTSFNTGTGANGSINAAHVQGDGKIVIVGGFTTFNGAPLNRIARLLPDASVDTSFSTGGGVGSAVGFILAQPDGKLILGGNGLTTFTYAGVTRNGLVRVNPDGTADSSFSPPAFGNTVDALALQRDGKVLVGGSFTTVAGATQNRLARLNADGSADTTFNANLGTGAGGTVNALTVQNDGKILVGGAFTTFNGASRTRLLRLSATGLIDSTFDAGTAITSTVTRLLVQENGAILVRGFFSFPLIPSVVNANSIVRLTAVGALDPTFAGYALTNFSTFTNQPLALADDGSVFAGGYAFSLVQGTDYSGLLHLKPGAAPVITVPLTDQVAALGANVTFTVGVTGSAPLTYVWFKSGVPIPGATTASLTRTNITADDEGHYSVSVNNAVGFANSEARLRGANPEPTVTVPLAATTFATAGGNTTLSVSATGTGTLAYQWFRDGQQIAGATSSSYTLSSVTPADAGAYGVRITDGLSQSGSETRVDVRPVTYPGALRVRTSFAPKFEQPGNVISLAVLADGSFYGVGSFNTANDTPRLTVARFLATGALDPAFNPVPLSGGNTTSIVVQPDGKVIVGGGFTTVASVDRPYLVRLEANGAVDASFNPGPGFNGSISALALQSDGALIVCGGFSTFNGAPATAVARLTATGSLDTSFSAGDTLFAPAAVAIQSDGKIIVGGSFTAYTTSNGFAATTGRIVRLNTDGSFDSTFTAGLGFDNTVTALALQSDGKIIAGGAFSNYAGSAANRIARLNSNGTFDSTFATGSGFNSTVSSLRLLSDGTVLAGGGFTFYNGTLAVRLARLSSVGVLDATFNTALGAGITTTAPGTTANVGSLAVQPDGSILVGGTFTSVNYTSHASLARLTPTGAVDATFNPSLRTSGSVISLVPLPDGSWLAGGLFTHVDNVPVGNLAKLSASGALDTTFNTALGAGFNSAINVILPQPGGKFLVGGTFTAFNGTVANRIARLNGNGTLDPSFVSGSGFNSTVGAMLQGAGGAITVGGNFTSYDGHSYNRIIRLTADGDIDESFRPGTGFNGFVTALARRPSDERLLVAGNTFTSVDGVVRANIARLNDNGSLDTTFVPPTTMPTLISSLIVLPDDRVLVGGATTSFFSDQPGVQTVNVVARLRADGSLDTDFSRSSGNFFIFSGTTTTSRPSLALQADGRILVSGVFAGANGELRGGLARLNANGTTDQSFGAPLFAQGLNNSHNLPLVYGADGALYVGGLYFNLPDRVLSGLAVFEPSTPALAINTPPASKSILAGQSVVLTVAAVGTGPVAYQWKRGGANVTDTIGRIAGSTTALLSIYGAQATDAGSYTVTVTDSSGSITSSAANLAVASSAPVAFVSNVSGSSAQTGSANVVRATLSAGTGPVTYQWTKNGADIPGASGTGPTNGAEFGDRIDYVSTAGWKSSDAGDYAIRLTNTAGTFTSNSVRMFAHDESTWTFHNQYPSSQSFEHVFTLNGQFLGLGGRGGRYVSPDGASWTQLPSVGTSTHRQYIVANGRHYLWGSRYYADSSDGVTWTSRTTGLASEAFSLAFGNGVFVSAATDGSVLRSTDGRTWTVVTFGNASNVGNVDGVAFANGAFVLLNGYGGIFRSTDGLTWTPQTAPVGLTLAEARSVNGHFIAYGQKGHLATSLDGITWLARDSGITGNINFAYHANGTYVLGADGRVLTSSDLVTWTPRLIPGAVQPRGDPLPVTGIAFLNGTWVATGTVLNTSPNLSDWTPRNSTVGGFQQFNGIAAGSGNVVAVGSGGVIARSTNGTIWSDQVSPTGNTLADVLFANGLYTAVGNSGAILRSTDGATWFGVNSGSTNNLTFVSLRNSLYLTGGASGTLLRSTDGASWTSVSSGLAITLNSAAYNAGRTVVVGATGAVRTTDDDLATTTTPTWTTRTSGTVENLTRVIYANNLYVAVGANGTILTSPDGATWTSRGYATPDDFNQITYTGGVFVVTGATQTISLSTDGLSWTARQTGYSGRLLAATAFDNRIIAVGAGSTIMSAGFAPSVAQPPGSQTLALGSPVNLGVIPGASVLPGATYQWRKNGTDIAGATTSTYTLASFAAGDIGNYDVVITNAAGFVTSAAASLAEPTTVAIADQPSSRKVAAGATVQLAVSATSTTSGATLTYQWRKAGTAISGATTSALTLTRVTAADAATYTVVVGDGTSTSLSLPAVLTVTTPDPVLWQQFTEFSTEQAPARTVHDGAGKVYVPWSVQDRAPDMANGKLVGALARFDEATGALDPTFRLDPRYRRASHVVVQPDGKLLVAVGVGDAHTVVRVTTTGAIDTVTPFNAPLFARGIRFITRQADGKVLVVAADNLDANAPASALGADALAIYRLNSNGTLDLGFTRAAVNSAIFGPPVVDSTGRIYLAGQFNQVNATSRLGVARLTSTGSLDSTFPTGLPAGFNFLQIRAVALQSGDRPVFVGDFVSTPRGTSADRAMAFRFTSAGAFDSTFAQPLRSELGIPANLGLRLRHLIVEADDTILAVSDRVVRLTADGAKDATFPSRAFGKEAFWISRGSNNHLFFADQTSVFGQNIALSTVSNGVAVVSPTGAGVSFQFQTGGWGRSAVVDTGVVLSDGRVWVGGTFNRYGATPVPGVALFAADGSLAPTQFAGSRTMSFGGAVSAGSDNVFVISGAPSNSSEVVPVSLVRVTTGATVDSGFTPVLPAGYSLGSASIASSPGGKLLLTQENILATDALAGNTGNSLLRLNSDGTRDTGFNAALTSFASVVRGAGNAVTAINTGGIGIGQVLPDGRVLVGTAGIDGTVRLLRLLDNGSVDSGFNPPSFGTIAPSSGLTGNLTDPVTGTTTQFPLNTYSSGELLRSVLQLPDGRVYLGGRLALAGSPRGLVRLTANGSLDATFTGAGLGWSKSDSAPYVSSLAVDAVGRVYVAGRFDSYNGTAVPAGLLRLKPDGTHDASWSSPISVLDAPRAVVRLSVVGSKLYAFGTVAAAADLLPVPYLAVDIPANVIALQTFESLPTGAGKLVTDPFSGFTGYSYVNIAPNFTLGPITADPIQGVLPNSPLGTGRAGYFGGAGTNLVPPTTNTFFTTTVFGGRFDEVPVNLIGSPTPVRRISADFVLARNGGTNSQGLAFYIYDARDLADPATSSFHSQVYISPTNVVSIADHDFAYAATSTTLANGVPYRVTITVNYNTATWSAQIAKIDGSATYALATDRPINTNGFTLSGWTTPGTFDIEMGMVASATNKALLDRFIFDNLVVTALPDPSNTIASVSPASASGGTLVTLTGTGFSGATAVKFNGLDALFTVVSDTSITATVPALATTGPITVVKPSGTLTSSASFTVTAGANLANLSRLGQVGPDGAIVLLNFTIEGTAAKPVLIRAVGPGLAALGIPGALADPQLTLHDATGAEIARNDDWGGGATLATAMQAVGAFALSPAGKDSALFATLAPGNYTARVTGSGLTTGLALAEVYDTGGTGARFAYLATRTALSTDHLATTSGFVLTGTGSRTVLIRVVGSPLVPALGAATNTSFKVYNAFDDQIATNDNWVASAELTAATAAAGALPLAANDAALLLNLSPGTYTVQAYATTPGFVLTEIHAIDSFRAAAFKPALLAPLQNTTVAAGAPLVLNAPVLAKPANVTYVWKKDGATVTTGVPLAGSPGALQLPAALATDTGLYTVEMTNSAGTTVSAPASVSVTPPVGYSATHAVVGSGGYVPGGTVTVTNTLAYSSSSSGALGWSVVLPPGWSYVSSSGQSGDSQPAAAATGTISWAWVAVPTSPVTFSYTLAVPAGETAPRTLTAFAIARPATGPIVYTANPNPLVVSRVSAHSADTNADFRLSLLELTRVIELFNTRNGTTRTGAYAVATGATEDGFVADTARADTVTATLAKYHSADSNKDGILNVTELSRVIQLYNVRAGTLRTGAYRAATGTEDGYDLGP